MSLGFLTPSNIALIVFVIALAVFVWRDRKNIERHSIMIIRRTDHGIELLDEIAERFPRLWRWWSTLGVIVSFVVLFGSFVFLFQQALKVFLEANATPALGLVLPTTSSTASLSPGLFLIPVWYWLIGIATVMVAHEMMHGVIARNEGFPVKSVGWFILGILPGAFVEPEGEEMMPDRSEDDEDTDEDAEEDEDDEETNAGPWGEGPWLGKLRVLAAGSSANITVGLIVYLLLFGMTTTAHGTGEIRGMYEHHGVEIVGVANNSAASAAGFKPGMVIRDINGDQVMDLRDFSRAVDDFRVGQAVTVAGQYNNTTFDITATLRERPSRNFTYQPAPVDPLLVSLEKRWPGTIELYENNNNLVVDDDKRVRLERWRWIKENNPSMSDTADRHIEALEQSLQSDPDPYLGIRVDANRTARAGFAPLETPLLVLMKLLFFVFLIHVGIGTANLMPIKPLDGGWMLSELMKKVRPQWEPRFSHVATAITVTFLVINLAFPFLWNLFV